MPGGQRPLPLYCAIVLCCVTRVAWIRIDCSPCLSSAPNMLWSESRLICKALLLGLANLPPALEDQPITSMLPHILFSLCALLSCSASTSIREIGNRTSQQIGSNSVMVVSGITGEDEYCLSVANGLLRFGFWLYAAFAGHE